MSDKEGPRLGLICSHAAQGTDLPMDVWGRVGVHLTTRDWSKACGTSRSSFAARNLFVAAKVFCDPSGKKDICSELLHLAQWATCHSLLLDVRQLREGASFTPAQIQLIKDSCKGLPFLKCLHIVGKDQNFLEESSIEGVLVSLIARHALVLSVKTLQVLMPFEFPALKHLVLELPSYDQVYKFDSSFPAITMATNLNTLHLMFHCVPPAESGPAHICECADLRGCKFLQRVALRNVRFMDGLRLPSTCILHAVTNRRVASEQLSTYARRVTWLTIRQCYDYSFWRHILQGRRTPNIHRLLKGFPTMSFLTHVRATLKQEDFDTNPEGVDRLTIHIDKQLKFLEVLQLELQCSVSVHMHLRQALDQLVLISKGGLHLVHNASRPPPKQMYLQSGAPLLPDNRAALEESGRMAGVRVVDLIEEERDGWKARIPASFQPSSLQGCFCGACLACLGQAGVPVLHGHAWKEDGFKIDLVPRCKGL